MPVSASERKYQAVEKKCTALLIFRRWEFYVRLLPLTLGVEELSPSMSLRVPNGHWLQGYQSVERMGAASGARTNFFKTPILIPPSPGHMEQMVHRECVRYV
jgi:hypothetical protein